MVTNLDDLKKIREDIDKVDNKLLELFEYRIELSHKVADYKKENNLPVYDPAREEEKLAHLRNTAKNQMNADGISNLFSQIMAISRQVQYSELAHYENLGFASVDDFAIEPHTKIAYYGETGSYSEQAMKEYFKGQGIGISMDTFEEVMIVLKNGQADYGVLPIENSSTGTLSDIFDLLADYDNYIIGEHVIAIDHNLWGLNEAAISDIKKIYSHHQGLLQCSGFLKGHPDIETVEGRSTAASARKVWNEKDISQAAIASKNAGETYGLKLLKASIHNNENNQTRFIVISNKRICLEKSKRISVCFVLPHRSGSLYNILSHFIHNNINMTRIESRPIRGKAFRYRFFVDFEGDLENVDVKSAIYAINQEADELKILGSYIAVE